MAGTRNDELFSTDDEGKRPMKSRSTHGAVGCTVFALLVLFPPTRAWASCEQCEKILQQGPFNVAILQKNDALGDFYRQALCRSTFEQTHRARGGSSGATLPIKGVPVTFTAEYDESQFRVWKTNNCTDTERLHPVLFT
jgi:hypothetical protein